MKRVLVRRVRVTKPRSRKVKGNNDGAMVITNDIVNQFNPSMLALGDISTPCQEKEAIVAVCDLTGFTKFCNQVDSYLAIPRFLSDFLEWFFDSIRDELIEENFQNHTSFWADLPSLVKFLGDGLLLVWNTRNMLEDQICRIVTSLYNICIEYRQEFYPKINMVVNKPPTVLRCGVARGKVFTVGNGKDYVGHCINNASRLSQLGPLSFCFPHRGFQVRDHMPEEYANLFIQKYISVRGVGDNELVWVVKDEFNRLPERGKVLFRDVERFST
jgi:class 3 adenylate cyclase